jgi:hypothetical protein
MDEVKRSVIGYLCLGIFHGLNAIGATLSSILMEMESGLSEKEYNFIAKHKTILHDEAQTMRQLGRRFTT